MPLMRCNSCDGTYQSVQDDGTPYYHACAPLPPTPEHPLGRERPNKRDENLVAHEWLWVLEDGSEVGGSEIPMTAPVKYRKPLVKSEGAGATPIPDTATAAPKR